VVGHRDDCVHDQVPVYQATYTGMFKPTQTETYVHVDDLGDVCVCVRALTER
jgi:hypothetical protein